MTLKIIQDMQYPNPVNLIDIHGKYPYKTYLEIKGNSRFGKFVAIVGDKPLKDITNIIINIKDRAKISHTNTVRPNHSSLYEIRYKVKEVNAVGLENETMYVFKCTGEIKEESNK